MEIQCVANLEVSADGKYVNGTSVFPVPGIRFGFQSSNGGVPGAGTYEIKGQLSQRSGVSDKGGSAKAYSILQVNGSAQAVKLAFQAVK